MQYHNFAITLTHRKLPIKKIADLNGLNVIAFLRASRYLGLEFGAFVKDNGNYIEIANQERQVFMLLTGKTDVAVMDESIFRFYHTKLISEKKVSAHIKVQFNDLFAPSRYRTAFIDSTIRDHFNQGLAQLKANGGYRGIYEKYTRNYFNIRQ